MNKLSFYIFFIGAILFCTTSKAVDKKFIDSLKHVVDTATQQKDRLYCLYSLTFEHGFFDPAKGLEYGNILQREAEAINSNKYKHFAYNGKSNCFETLMNYDSVLYYNNLAYELYRDSPNVHNKQVCLMNLAIIHKKMGHYNLALHYTLKGDSIKKIELRNPRDYLYKCLLFLRINNLKKARESIDSGIVEYKKDFQANQFNNFIGLLYSYLGLTLNRQGKHDSAIAILKKSILFLENETDLVALADANTFLGEAFFRIKKYESSIHYYHVASDYYKKLNNSSQQNFLIINELRSKAYTKNYSIDALKKELETAYKNVPVSASSYEIKLDLYALLSECYEQLGDYKLSLKYSRLFEELNKEVLDNENRLQFLEYQKSFENLSRENKITQLNQENANNSLKLENKNLQVNRYIIIVISVLLLFFVSLFLFIQINKKNKALMQTKAELQIKEANEKERIRISREMHDDIGAGLTQITLMSQHLQQKTNSTEASDIVNVSRRIVTNISEIIWSLNNEFNTLNDLFSYTREQLNSLLNYSSINGNINLIDTQNDVLLTNEQKRNIFLIIKEIAHNAIKYSQANELIVNANYDNGRLHIFMKDDGKGFDESIVKKGNGLKNIKLRVAEIRGVLNFETGLSEGTKYEIDIPI